jgi:nucleoside-triphosphatase THEP1
MLKVLGTIMLNIHPFADAVKRHPELEMFLVTGDNRTEVMKKVLTWLSEAVN